MKYRFTFLLSLCLALCFTGIATASITDVNGHWAKNQIEKWVSSGLVAGYTDGTFQPEKEISRAEFVALVNRAYNNQDKNAQCDFLDVGPSDWFYHEVALCKANGYISGYPDGTFRPNSPVSRQEAAAIMVKLLNLSANSQDATVIFKDVNTFPAWSKPAINTVVTNKIMGGYGDGTFKADKSITRAEAVVILDRALGKTIPQKVAFEGIEGTVLMNSQPVEGAVVKLFAKDGYDVLKESITDKDGKYEFAITNGIYDLTVAFNDFLGYTSDISATMGPTSATITLVQGAKVKGKLLDKSDKPFANVKVVFTTNPTFVTTTNADGEFSINVLPNRKYSVRSFVPGTETAGIKDIAADIEVGESGTDLESLKASFSIGSTVSGGGGGRSGGGNSTIAVTAINVSPTAMTLYAGGATGIITDTVSPNNATNKRVNWESSHPEIATVSDGVVTPLTVGSTTISAITVDGGFTATTNVIVLSPEVTVNTDTELNDALANDQITKITFGYDIITNAAVTFNGQEINGNGQTLTGDLEVSGDNVVIKDLKVDEGVVTITESVYNFTAQGTNFDGLTINGGSSNSIKLENATVVTMNINKESVRVVLKGTSNVTTVNVEAPNVTLASGPNVKITTTAGSEVGTLTTIDLHEVTFVVRPLLAGTTISIDGETLTADVSGEAFIELGDGEYSYTVTAAGYSDESGSVTVSGGDITETITLTIKNYAYYSEDYSIPQSLSPDQLSNFMTEPHTDYHQYGWNFGASLLDSSNNTLGFFIAIEYDASNDQPYRGGVGFSKTESEGYRWSGFTNSYVETTTNPWSVKLTSPYFPGSYIMIELSSGLMGAPDAVYRFTADVIDFADGKNLKVDVLLRDQFGVINQGYGTTSFFPHYLTADQRREIMELPEKTIDEYLITTGDKMSWQGDYYYAMPLMDVEQFKIEYDGDTLNGTTGKCWMDYFVKSYNEESLEMQKGANWDWIAVQLPDINTAINILNIRSEVAEPLPYARLFNLNGDKTINGARMAAHSWAIDKITVQPFGEEWETPTGNKYSMQYRIILESSTLSGDLTVTMLRKNQAVVLPEGSNYQGLGIVEGVLGGQTVHGQCWVEVQPVGGL